VRWRTAHPRQPPDDPCRYRADRKRRRSITGGSKSNAASHPRGCHWDGRDDPLEHDRDAGPRSRGQHRPGPRRQQGAPPRRRAILEGRALDILSTWSHRLYGAAWGLVLWLLVVVAGLPIAVAGVAFFLVVWLTEQIELPVLGIAPWPWKWGLKENLIDAGHHVAYAAGTIGGGCCSAASRPRRNGPKGPRSRSIEKCRIGTRSNARRS